MHDGPLIVQSDKTLLLEVDHEQAVECRRAIAPFAELERSPEHIHTYRLTPLGLWNARAAGHDAEQVVDALLTYSRYAVPHSLLVDVAETMARYGRLRLEKHPTHGLVLSTTDRPVLEEVVRAKRVAGMLGARLDDDSVVVHPSCSVQHLGLAHTLHALAAAMATTAVTPTSAACCGFAGDRGFLHDELTRSATSHEAAEVNASTYDAYLGSNRTCEIGLHLATGRPYESFVFLLEELTRPGSPTSRQ